MRQYSFFCSNCYEDLYTFETYCRYKLKNSNDGSIVNWTIDEILYEINRDRSDEWTDYDSNDWKEGLYWTDYVLIEV